jgi:hypothetical protein
LVPRSSGTPVATWAWPTFVVSRRRVLEAVFILLEFLSPSRRIFIGSHSLPPLWFAVSVLHWVKTYHPRNVWFTEFVSSSWVSLGMKSLVSRKGNIHEKIFLNFIHLANLLIICEINSRIGFSSRINCLFQGDGKLAKIRKPGTCRIRESWEAFVRESWRFVNFMNEASEVEGKPSQRCLYKNSGFEVWTSGRLVNVWS